MNKKQLKELIREEVQKYLNEQEDQDKDMGKPPPGMSSNEYKKYQQGLQTIKSEVTDKLANNILSTVNKFANKLESDYPEEMNAVKYVKQAVLEHLVEELENRI